MEKDVLQKIVGRKKAFRWLISWLTTSAIDVTCRWHPISSPARHSISSPTSKHLACHNKLVSLIDSNLILMHLSQVTSRGSLVHLSSLLTESSRLANGKAKKNIPSLNDNLIKSHPCFIAHHQRPEKSAKRFQMIYLFSTSTVASFHLALEFISWPQTWSEALRRKERDVKCFLRLEV